MSTIQSQIDALESTGGVVRLPAGTHEIAEPLRLYSNVWLCGDGLATKVVCTGEEGIVKAAPGALRTGAKLSDLLLYSQSAGYGVDLSGFSYSAFRDFSVQVKGSNRKCIKAVGGTGVGPYYNVLDGLTISGDNAPGVTIGSVGISFERGDQYGGPNANLITNVRRMCGLDVGFDLVCGHGNLISQAQIEAVNVAAFRLGSATPTQQSKATAATLNSLTDATQQWATGSLTNSAIKITSGPGAGQIRRIQTNTATTLTLFDYWTIVPGEDDFEIYRGGCYGNKISQVRLEGNAGASLIRVNPGAYANELSHYECGSIGQWIIDPEINPSNRLLPGAPVPLSFVKDGVPAGLVNSYSFAPKRSVYPWGGGHASLGIAFCITAVTVSCTRRDAGEATIVVDLPGSPGVELRLDAQHPYTTSAPVPYTSVRWYDPINVRISTSQDWAPTTAGICVDVWGTVVS